MILVTVSELRKHFGPEPVLDGVSFDLRPGERVGLVGPNGAGKTTLMRIVAGLESFDAGTLALHPTARLGYLAQRPDFTLGRTLWDEAESALVHLKALAAEAEEAAHRLAASPHDDPEHERLAARYDRLQHEVAQHGAYEFRYRIERVLDGLGFARQAHSQPVESLSGGQQNRLLLAKLLLGGADLLLLDEPSNHLDIEATEWLERFLVESQQAMLVVSHDRYLLDKVTNRTLELVNGTVESYPGNFSQYWRLKGERLEVERRTFERQQEFIAKTEDFIRRNKYGQKSAQAKDREKKLARVEAVARPRTIAAPAFGFPAAARTGDIVLRVEHLAKGYDRALFDDLNWDVLRGQHWGVLGPNGSGKTTLLRCLVGQVRPDAGHVITGTGVQLGYYDQMLTGLDPQSQVVDAIRPPRKEFTEPQRRDLLAKFGLTGDAVFQTAASLSGGERSRAALARLAAEEANVLVLDEPTNHLDLWARDALERALMEFDGTVLFVSHDRYFLNRVADHMLVLDPPRVRVIDGNYETFLALQESWRAAAGAAEDRSVRQTDESRTDAEADGTSPSTATARADGKPARRKRRFPYRKAADIEHEIHERETSIAQLEASLATAEVYRSAQRMREVPAQIAAEKASLARLYEHWEEATELNG
ncbi:MAG: ABC-F family ATP-binding cassette domain-containing protein [Pirellulales bacterium]|nr:ABC-F family ATP-binding cassette domain-containing protein [Pirellulales bacterium]